MFSALKVFAGKSCASDHSTFWTQSESNLDSSTITTFKPLAAFHSDSAWPGLMCVWNLNLVPQHATAAIPAFFHTAGWPQ